MFRAAVPEEISALVSLGLATGLFNPEDANLLLGQTLDDLHAGRLPEGHQAHVWIDDRTEVIAGWAYFAPTPKADGVWDLWWIGVHPKHQKTGIGRALLTAIEDIIRAMGGRLLVIETSSLPPLENTRRFYVKRGYSECGKVLHFYAMGDDKVIFAKQLAEPSQ